VNHQDNPESQGNSQNATPTSMEEKKHQGKRQASR